MNIHKHIIEKIVITGVMGDFQKAVDYCNANGYSIWQSGPRRVSIGRVDITRFKIVAERVKSK